MTHRGPDDVEVITPMEERNPEGEPGHDLGDTMDAWIQDPQFGQAQGRDEALDALQQKTSGILEVMEDNPGSVQLQEEEPCEYVRKLQEHLATVRQEARDNLERASDSQKQHYN
ncbi:UNVERIFIED_CONTAM: hypothetical protein K2H54_042692 [Gekko kuhli]